MIKRVRWLLACGGLLVGADRARAAEPEPSAARQALERGLTFVKVDAEKWRKDRKCATCHHGVMTVWTLGEAKRLGHDVDPAALDESAKWTRAQFVPKLDKPRNVEMGGDYNGVVSLAGMNLLIMDRVVPGLNALPAADREKALAHVPRFRESDGRWSWSSAPAKNTPPPVFESDEVATLQACLALGTTEAPTADWLSGHRSPTSTQALALRLLLAVQSNSTPAEVEAASGRIYERQQADGGWGQDADLPSDAYATGQALYFLSLAGARPERTEIQRGVAFLVARQRENGSWPMASRGHPGVKPMTNPVPITYFGSAWATLGLLRSVPK